MSKCRKCGKELKEDIKFCPDCGAYVYATFNHPIIDIRDKENQPDEENQEFVEENKSLTQEEINVSEEVCKEVESNEKVSFEKENNGENLDCGEEFDIEDSKLDTNEFLEIEKNQENNVNQTGEIENPVYSSQENGQISFNNEIMLQMAVLKKSASSLFVLSFAGLLLNFIFGLGALLCFPVALIATSKSKAMYSLINKVSTKLIWSMVIGYLGSLIGAIFFILMVI